MSPIKNLVGTVFVPVKDLQKSAQWYSELFGLPLGKVSPPVYNIKTDGQTTITLDVNTFENTIREDEVTPSKYGLLQLPTSNIDDAVAFLNDKGIEMGDVVRIYNVAFVMIKDPDGNQLMIYDNNAVKSEK